MDHVDRRITSLWWFNFPCTCCKSAPVISPTVYENSLKHELEITRYTRW